MLLKTMGKFPDDALVKCPSVSCILLYSHEGLTGLLSRLTGRREEIKTERERERESERGTVVWISVDCSAALTALTALTD